ncbi:MAG TPA: primosomal protein N' [Gemmatimonadales bacterium]|nr:primosomal protein N' [Gemmatimonadales bacterium]
MIGFARVALPLPLSTAYTYRIPETLADRVSAGARVVVPVRRRELVGIVVSVDDAPSAGSDGVPLKDLLAAPDAEPAMPAPLLRAAEWMAGYYGAPLGLALRAALPAGLWGASRVVATLERAPRTVGGLAGRVLAWLEEQGGEAAVASMARGLGRSVWDALDRLARVGAVSLRVEPPDTSAAVITERLLVLAEPAPTLLEREALFRRSRRQRELYEALEGLGGHAPVRHAVEQLGFSAALVRALVRRRLARVESTERVRDPFAVLPATPPPEHLTGDQAAALHAIGTLAPGEGALLFGVTGSGKTLVYLEAVRRLLAAGHGAIVLVPEIGLTPQTVSRFRGAFGDDVAVLHSGLSDGERADAWRLLRRGERRVAVGARSAVFAPVQRLGIIVLDEEHEATYKNGETPRYHTRDVAAVRARLEGAALVLGSATPSLETLALALAAPVQAVSPASRQVAPPESSPAPAPRRLQMVRLPERIGMRPLPPVELVDLRTAPKVADTGPVAWSEPLDGAVGAVLARGEQALLLLNRRGWASFLQCPDCGEVWQCPRCSVSLTVHRHPSALRCHYCGHEEPMPFTCRACASPVYEMRGVGTQQLERVLAERYPAARVARMDLDATSTKWSHQRILGAVERGEVDLLVGTQMIAKGLDFPNVTLVGVVDADTGLHLPDFRSAERTFQLLAQVAGRAGRGPKGGRVLVQTRSPRHPALVHAAQHDTEGFLAAELGTRRAPPYPPIVALVNLIVSGPAERAVSRRAAQVADWCTAVAARHALAVEVLGPAPCPLARIKDRWRWHVLLKGPSRVLGRVVRYAARRPARRGDTRVVIDRDPASVL